MGRIQISSLDEFVASLSRLNYEAARVASGKVMEDHIPTGALMFSLLTIETMYTSMDYLTPENFRRGNSYLLNMYSPLPRRLNQQLRTLVSEYEKEHQRLLSLNAQSTAKGSAIHSLYGASLHGSELNLGLQNDRADDETDRRHIFASQMALSNGPGAHHDNSEDASGSQNSGSTSKARLERERRLLDIGAARPATEYYATRSRAGSGAAAEPFDPNQYLANMEEAEAVLRELETIRQFFEFITKFVEVRKTMVVLYRFVAVTGPVIYVHKLRIMLERCRAIIETIEPNPLYACLVEHVRHEIWLVSILVDWNSHIVAYDFVQAVTHMKKAKQQLRAWQNVLPAYSQSESTSSRRSTIGHGIYESVSNALGARHDKKSAASQNASHGLFYTALAKSSRIVHNLLWPGTNSGASDNAHDLASGGMRGIVIWITAWVDYLSFKTTTYFQQVISPYRSLYHDDMTAHAKQAAVMGDTWSRPGMANVNLFEMASEFMQANDGCFVALLFESSKQHPFVADGFAVSGTKVHVPDYRVQACAVLFCFTNQLLLRSRGIAVKDSLVRDVHTGQSDPATRGAAEVQRQSDVEWFRQNCLPDILGILDNNRATLDLELLGSSPLLNRLGNDADDLLVELCDSVHDTVDDAAAQLAIAKEAANARMLAERGAHSTGLSGNPPGTAQSQSGQAADVLRLSAMKTLPSAEQRQRQQQQQQQPVTPKYDSKHHSPSALSVPASERTGTSDPQMHPRPLDDSTDNIVAMQTTSSGSGLGKPHVPVSEGDNSDANLSLYSTYLRKSHLRNNVQHHQFSHGGIGGPRYASRQPAHRAHVSRNQPPETSDVGAAGSTEDLRRRAGHASLDTMETSQGERSRSMASTGGQQSQDSATQTSNALSQRHTLQDSRAAANRPAEPATAVDYLTSRGSAATLKTSPAENATFQRRVSTGVSTVQNEAGKQAAQDSPALLRRSGRATTTALGTSGAKQRRPSLSIRSFFRQAPRPSAPSRAQSAATPSASESELDRRMRCGERLQELFGPWNQDEHDDVPEDASASRVSSHRPSSIHSLSFSTPMRASLGRRAGAGVGDAVAAGADMAAAALDADSTGSRFAPRPLHSPTHARHTHARPQGSRPPATRRVSELGHAIAEEYLQHRSQPPRPQQLHELPVKPQQPHFTPHAGQSATPIATGGSEGYTYLFSRVGLPNVLLVAVVLDSDKGLERRREAERAWDAVVDAVRGAPLFDQLTAFSG